MERSEASIALFSQSVRLTLLIVLFDVGAGEQRSKKAFLRELPDAAWKEGIHPRDPSTCARPEAPHSRGAQDDRGREISVN